MDFVVSHTELALAIIAMAISILLGFMSAGRLRTSLITGLWLAPLWLAIWFAVTFAEEIKFEFGSWWFPFFWMPVFLAIWALVTVAPFKLTVRIRAINSGMF